MSKELVQIRIYKPTRHKLNVRAARMDISVAKLIEALVGSL